MKKTTLLLSFLMLGLTMFGQYTGNKLPSGLTVADTASDADYTIIQKSGETYVKAIRMDSLRSYMSTGINEAIVVLDSVSGQFGQFIISDGTGFLAPVSAKYEGTDAYTFGYRSGTVGSKSFVIGGSSLQPAIASGNTSVAIGRLAEATAATSIAMGLYARATGVESIAVGSNSLSSGYAAFSTPYSTASGDYSAAFISGTASGDYSFAVGSKGEAGGDYSIALSGTASAPYSFAVLGDANGSFGVAIGNGCVSNSYQEIVIGARNDTITPSSTSAWVATDRLFTIGNGTGPGSKSNALVMLKNGNTTINGNWNFTDTIMAAEGFIKNKAHGFYAFEDSAVVIDCTVNDWVQITNATNDLFTAVQDNAGFTISGDTIYFNQPALAGMTPHIIFHYGIDGFAGNNEDYEVRIFNVSNNAGVMRKAEGSTTGAANRIEIGTTAYDNQAAFGDAYILQIVNRTNSNDFTIENGSVFLEVSHY